MHRAAALDGQMAFVTGASSGLGRATARSLADAGRGSWLESEWRLSVSSTGRRQRESAVRWIAHFVAS
jgi:NADP-dependent 3-hydroxy acid dehydrogenase YdfG